MMLVYTTPELKDAIRVTPHFYIHKESWLGIPHWACYEYRPIEKVYKYWLMTENRKDAIDWCRRWEAKLYPKREKSLWQELFWWLY